MSLAVFVSDIHFPEHEPDAWESFLSWVDDEQPETIVLGGDILENRPVSAHGDAEGLLADELAQAWYELKRLRDAAPDATVVYLEGNHEHRLQRAIQRFLPGLKGLLSIPELLRLPELGIDWYDFGVPYHLGKLRCVHGWWAPINAARKHLQACGENVIHGHVHRPQIMTEGTVDGHLRIGISAPCMRRLDADFLWNRPSGWGNGFVPIEIDDETGYFWAYPIIMQKGGWFRWGGVEYGSRVGDMDD